MTIGFRKSCIGLLSVLSLIGLSSGSFAQTAFESNLGTTQINLRGVQKPDPDPSGTTVLPAAEPASVATIPLQKRREDVFTRNATTLPLASMSPASSALAQTTTSNYRQHTQTVSPSHITLSSGILARLASIYAQFQIDVRDRTSDSFTSFDEIRDGLYQMGGTNAQQAAYSALAFAAVIVSQDPDFRTSVINESRRVGTDAYLASLAKQPYPAIYLAGAKPAIHKAQQIVKTDFRYVEQAGLSMKESSYLLQSNSWARKKIVGKTKLMSSLEQQTATHRLASKSTTDSLHRTLSMEQVNSGLLQRLGLAQALNIAKTANTYGSRRFGQTPNIEGYKAASIAALAAFIVLGEDTQEKAPQIRQILNIDLENEQCLEMAQLNLMQCTAAMHNTYEIPYCIGEHALIEVAACHS